MSAWELLAVLVLVAAGAELVRGKSLVVAVDNQGSISIFRKGWCTSCMLCTTIALALSEVAASLDCKLEVVKVRRCSTREAEAADAISKAGWRRFKPWARHGARDSIQVGGGSNGGPHTRGEDPQGAGNQEEHPGSPQELLPSRGAHEGK